MLYWVPALLIAILAIVCVFRISRGHYAESFSHLSILLALTAGIFCSMVVSSAFDGLLSPVVLGTQFAAAGMGALLIILCVVGGLRKNLPGIIMGLLVAIPIITIPICHTSYYWMTAVASIATAADLLFWKKEGAHLVPAGTDARKTLPVIALIAIAVASLCLAVILFCTGGLIPIVEEFAHLSVFIGWSAMLMIAEAVMALIVAKRVSLDSAIALTMYMSALDLFLGFLTSVVMWA